jgi:hypothetical protein
MHSFQVSRDALAGRRGERESREQGVDCRVRQSSRGRRKRNEERASNGLKRGRGIDTKCGSDRRPHTAAKKGPVPASPADAPLPLLSLQGGAAAEPRHQARPASHLRWDAGKHGLGQPGKEGGDGQAVMYTGKLVQSQQTQNRRQCDSRQRKVKEGVRACSTATSARSLVNRAVTVKAGGQRRSLQTATC